MNAADGDWATWTSLVSIEKPNGRFDPQPPLIADANGDGRDDLWVRGESGWFVGMYRRAGDPACPDADEPCIAYEALSGPPTTEEIEVDGETRRVTRPQVLIDVDDDGLVDILDLQNPNALVGWINQGPGRSFAPIQIEVQGDDLPVLGHISENDVQLADMDGDGRQDLVVYSVAEYMDSNGEALPVGAQVAREMLDFDAVWFTSNSAPRADVFLARGEHFEARRLPNGYESQGPVYVPSSETLGRFVFPNGEPAERYWPRNHVLDLSGDGIPELLRERFQDPTRPIGTQAVYSRSDLLESVAAGGRQQASFAYSFGYYTRRCDETICVAPRDGCAYPDVCGGTRLVVGSHTDIVGRTYDHHFMFPRWSVGGEGWLGFEFHRSADATRTSIVETELDFSSDDLEHPFAREVSLQTEWIRDEEHAFSIVTRSETKRSVRALTTGGTTVTVDQEASHTWQIEGSPPACVAVNSCRPPTGAPADLVRATIHDFDYSSSGALARSVVRVPGVETTETNYLEFDERPADWLFLPRFVTVTSTVASGQTATRSHRYDWDDLGRIYYVRALDGGLKATLSYDPDTALLDRVAWSGHDGEDLATRTTTFAYDADGVFIEREFNTLGHETTTVTDPRSGVPVYAVDARGVETRVAVDTLGRPVSHTTNGGTIAISYAKGDVFDGFPTILTRLAGLGVDSSQETDLIGRVHRLRQRGWQGTTEELIEYDAEGRPTHFHAPHYRDASGLPEPHALRSVTYDAASRVRWTDFHDGGRFAVNVYAGREHYSINRREHVSRVTYDLAGRVARSDEFTDSSESEYVYGPFGQLEAVVDHAGHQWRVERDDYGRIIGSFDPDSGWQCHQLNAFGEVVAELKGSEKPDEACSGYADAEQPISRTRRDAIGRVESIDHTQDGLTEFVWDVDLPGTIHAGFRSYDNTGTWFEYDEYARPEAVETGIDSHRVRFEYDYDSRNRLSVVHYPATRLGGDLAVEYHYDDTRGGLLDYVADQHGNRIWSAGDYDALGRWTESVLPNGIEVTRSFWTDSSRLFGLRAVSTWTGEVLQDYEHRWDLEGNLESRRDLRTAGEQQYQYDLRNRLIYAYDKKPDVARTYDYDAFGNLTLNRGVEQRFDADHPHQLLERGSATGVYAQYERGVRTSTADGFRATYNAFNLPEWVRGRTGVEAHFDYDAFGARVRRETEDDSTITVGLYEASFERDVLIGESRRIAIGNQVIAEEVDGQYFYYLADHLGSPEALVDQDAKVVERYEFEPYGLRGRFSPEMGPPDGVPHTDTGFTGHRQEDDLGLIDMGGRFYDPVTASFLTPDPVIHSALDRSSYNSYAYAAGNPLRFVDPTGFDWCDGGCGDTGAGILGLVAGFFAQVFGGGLTPQQRAQATASLPPRPPPTAREAARQAYREWARGRRQPSVSTSARDGGGGDWVDTALHYTAAIDRTPGPLRRTFLELGLAVVQVPLSMIPWVGAGMDGVTLADPDSEPWEQAIAGASLTVEGFTAGASPNAGPFLRALRIVRRGSAPWHYAPGLYHVIHRSGLLTRVLVGQLGRIERVTAVLTQAARAQRGTRATRAATRHGRLRSGRATDDAGHVVARALGGDGGLWNTFGQLPHINRGQFMQWEQQIADAVDAGSDVRISVVLNYADPANVTRVTSIDYNVWVDGVHTVRNFTN
ncbi:Hypothetical protein I5071_10440 [Sandaracinus amylolyticus]|nr:Hypothetical protein I5071_10440 [Sandaracinus amylolyticus]